MNSSILLAPIVIGLGLFSAGCNMLAKVDRERFFSRAGWTQPDKVIATLALSPGARVADVGAGDGHFAFRIGEVVGADGRVYAVEVDDDLVAKLQRKIEEDGLTNVTAVRGQYDDPRLPDGPVDLIFFSGVFHHIEKPAEYFPLLRKYLTPSGRIAIVDGTPDPLHQLIMPFHFASADQVETTMTAAGYRRVEHYDFLPTMNFQVFAPK